MVNWISSYHTCVLRKTRKLKLVETSIAEGPAGPFYIA